MKVKHYVTGVRQNGNSWIEFFVQSTSRPDIDHVVVLTGFGVNGSCSCESFGCNLAPSLKRGSRKHRLNTQCEHIWKAQQYLLEEIIPNIHNAEHQGEKNNG